MMRTPIQGDSRLLENGDLNSTCNAGSSYRRWFRFPATFLLEGGIATIARAPRVPEPCDQPSPPRRDGEGIAGRTRQLGVAGVRRASVSERRLTPLAAERHFDTFGASPKVIGFRESTPYKTEKLLPSMASDLHADRIRSVLRQASVSSSVQNRRTPWISDGGTSAQRQYPLPFWCFRSPAAPGGRRAHTSQARRRWARRALALAAKTAGMSTAAARREAHAVAPAPPETLQCRTPRSWG